MRRAWPTIGCLLWSLVALAGPGMAEKEPPESPAEAYARALYLQRSRGQSEAALAVLDGLREANGAGLSAIDLALRRADCLRWGGRLTEAREAWELAIAGSPAAARRLGAAVHFPGQLDLVLHLDVAALRRFAPVDEWLRQLQRSSEWEFATRWLGFDLLRDVDRLTLAVALQDDLSWPVRRWIVLFEGRLGLVDRGAIEDAVRAALRDRGPNGEVIEVVAVDQDGRPTTRTVRAGVADSGDRSRRQLRGHDALMLALPLPGGAGAGLQVGLVQLDAEHVWVGDSATLERALAARTGQRTGLLANRRLSDLVASTTDGAQLWLAAIPAGVARLIGAGAFGLPDKLPDLQGLVFEARFEAGLQLEQRLLVDTPESARQVGDLCKGLVALGRLATQKEAQVDPWVAKFMEGLRIETREREVLLRASWTGERVVEMLRAFRETVRHPHGGQSSNKPK